MFQRILVVFENEEVCNDALVYARELSLRMDSEVSLLMLVGMTFLDHSYLGSKRNAIAHIEESGGRVLSRITGEFIKHGIAVSAALRVGHPAEELVKFLAGKPPFQAIIWGSSATLPENPHFPRGHWIRKVAGNLECPLLTVASRDEPGGS